MPLFFEVVFHSVGERTVDGFDATGDTSVGGQSRL